MIAPITSAFCVGLLGSLHCAGMCGPLALAVGSGGGTGGKTALRLALFVGGKAATYVGLGVAAGTIGSAFGAPGLGKTGFAVLALLVGIAMIGIGGHALWRRIRPSVAGGNGSGAVGTLLKAVLSSRGPAAPLFAGLLAGLLPCGLVYAMIAQSLTAGTTVGGGLVMAAFGLGTAPSLMAAGGLGRTLGGRARAWGESLAALSVVAMGSVALWRGLAVLLDASGAGGCCHHGA